MALIIKDLVQDTSTSTGTGDITVSGTPAIGFVAFDTAMSASDTTFLNIRHQTEDQWEICVATYSGSNVLARGSVLASSTGSAVDFAAGVKDVWINMPAAKMVYKDASGDVSLPGGLTVTGTVNGRTLATDGAKLDGIEAGADVTDAGNVGSTVHGASSKSTPVDVDELGLVDSAASNVLKKLTWANVKATLKTYFDTLYQPVASALTSWGGVTRASGFDTFAATPSSANLRALLTDEVGTGAAYFVGGALGTPASGTLTNCTGYPTTVSITFIIDGAGNVLSTGIGGDLSIPFACTIQSWTLLADQSGSIVLNIWKDTLGNFPPTVADKITASAPPTISSATNASNSTLTGWTTSISAGDTLRFNIDSVTSITRITLALKVAKS